MVGMINSISGTYKIRSFFKENYPGPQNEEMIQEKAKLRSNLVFI
jgi:hypothetical protein